MDEEVSTCNQFLVVKSGFTKMQNGSLIVANILCMYIYKCVYIYVY